MLYIHGVPGVKTLSLSVGFAQRSHFELSDLGYRPTCCCAVGHKKTELCDCTDLRVRWKQLERKTGRCQFSAYLCSQEILTGFQLDDS